MSDFISNTLLTAWIYCLFLAGIFSVRQASKNIRIFLICLIIILFSVFNAWVMNIKEKTLPLEAVDKEWNRYVIYCREEHISWSDLTFPEWLSLEVSE